jgi:hypothetical protein
MKMSDSIQNVYNSLIQRCKEVEKFEVRCLIDMGDFELSGSIPFDFKLNKDGIAVCHVIAFTEREAQLKVVDTLPVLKFLEVK